VDRRVSYLWKEPRAAAGYQTAVSLHGHTSHSKEGLSFLSEHAREIPVLFWLLQREQERAKRKGGITVDFLNSYWLPPVAPRTAYDLESRQITDDLQLQSLVSLTDHDNIEAPLLLRTLADSAQIPISFEWSVPYSYTELHLGVHNLPAKNAQAIVNNLNDYTDRPSPARLRELLVALDNNPEVLIVFNHPSWDLCRVGAQRHRQALLDFMASFGQYVHAFEISGLRGWDENQRTVDLAMGWNQPVISGGDRHGYEPSGCVNLTSANTFSEFAEEVRHGRSHVLFMPHYAKSLTLRIIQVVNDAVQSYPESPIGEEWYDRVYHPDKQGVVRQIRELWEKPPAYIGTVLAGFRWFESGVMQRAAQAFMRPEQQLRWSSEAS
jgi:hypothetical protein